MKHLPVLTLRKFNRLPSTRKETVTQMGEYQESQFLSREQASTLPRSGRGSVSVIGGGTGASAGKGFRSPRNNHENTAPPPYDPAAIRLERYALQSASRAILPDERIAKCLRSVAPMFGNVNILKSVKKDSFKYGNLIVCGSVWNCPVCASKITEHRRAEIVAAVETAKSRGAGVYLLSLTVPHYANQKLQTVLDGISKAKQLMQHRKPWKRLIKSVLGLGEIRTLEVTYGDNGWHPHFHVLLFTGLPIKKESFSGLEESILNEWKSACVTAGLPEPNEHGVSLDDGSKAASYASKWGLEHEMTKGHVKKAKKGKTPFDLLRWYLKEQDPKAKKLFQEYAKCFKGKRQLVWSRGLRNLLNLASEKTDQDIAESIDEESVVFAQLTLNVWWVIVKNNKRAEILEVCRNGIESLHDYLIELMESEMKVET